MTARTLLLILSLYSVALWAQPNSTTFIDGSERIVEIKLTEGLSLSDSLIIYPHGNSWMIPLGGIAEALGYPITPFTALGTAKGSLKEGGQAFELRTASCEVRVNDQMSKYPCEQVVSHKSDFYVEMNLLQTWLPISLTFDTYSSTLLVKPLKPLAIQEAMERERRAKMIRAVQREYDLGYPRLKVPSAMTDGPFIDQQLTFNYGQGKGDFSHDTAFVGETFGITSTVILRGRDDKMLPTQLNLAKRDPEGKMLGPLHAKDIELFDFTMPTLPIVGGGGFGRGAFISSFPLNSPSNYSSQDIQGSLPTGWDVELYQNDTLIGRESSNDSGRYNFKSIPLLYGLNRFRLTFYGPQGQRRDEFLSYNIGNGLQRPGETDFRAAYGRMDTGDKRAVIELNHNLAAGLGLRASSAVLTPTKDDQSRQYHSGTLIGSLRNLLATGTFTYMDNGGSAQEFSLQAPFERVILGVKKTLLHDFHSELFVLDPLRKMTESNNANMAWVVSANPALRMTLDATQNKYDTGEIQNVFTHRTSLLTGRLLWNHELQVQDGLFPAKTGELSANFISSLWQIRSGFEYDQNHVTTAEINLQRRFSEKYIVNTGASQRFSNEVTTLTANINRLFKYFTLSGTSSYETSGEFSIGSTLSYSLSRDKKGKGWDLQAKPQSQFGSASVLVYLDKNRNSVFDAGDEPLPNIQFQSPQRQITQLTSSTGRAFLPQLPPFQPFDLSVAPSSIEDPYQRTVSPGVRFVPRMGTAAHVEFPIQVFCDISGRVTGSDPNKRGIPIELFDLEGKVIKTVLTESDGFFTVEGLAPGELRVRIDPDYLSQKNAQAEPAFRTFVAPARGDSIAGLDFSLL